MSMSAAFEFIFEFDGGGGASPGSVGLPSGFREDRPARRRPRDTFRGGRGDGGGARVFRTGGEVVRTRAPRAASGPPAFRRGGQRLTGRG